MPFVLFLFDPYSTWLSYLQVLTSHCHLGLTNSSGLLALLPVIPEALTLYFSVCAGQPQGRACFPAAALPSCLWFWPGSSSTDTCVYGSFDIQA